MTAAVMRSLILAIPILAAVAVEPPVMSIKVSERQTDYIAISWLLNDTDNVIESYKVKVNDATEDYTITYEGETYIDHKKNEAKVVVHESDKPYNICIVAILKPSAAAELSTPEVLKCIEASTIKTIQPSSIVALILTVLFFVMCFVVGYIAWKCSYRRLKKSHEYEKSDVNGNGDIVPLTHIED